MLAGVSVSWYTWLEQARRVTASAQVLNSISRALELTPAEHAHLFSLAGADGDSPVRRHGYEIDDETVAMVHALAPHAAYVLSPVFDVIAHNQAAEIVMRDLLSRPAGERNMLRWLFRDGGWDQNTPEWQTTARANVEDFRAGYAQLVDDPDARALVDELSTASSTFQGWWAEHEVRDLQPTRKALFHSTIGPLTLLQLQTRLAHAPALRLRILVPGDDATRKRMSARSG